MRSRSGNAVVAGVAVLLLTWGLVLSRAAATSVDELGRLALGLAIIVTAALVGGHFAVSIGQPAVLGELVAGIGLGNAPGLAGLQFIGADPYLDILSRVWMLLLLFEVGLDLSVRDLLAVGRSSFAVAVIGTASTLAIGMGTAAALMPDMSIVNHCSSAPPSRRRASGSRHASSRTWARREAPRQRSSPRGLDRAPTPRGSAECPSSHSS